MYNGSVYSNNVDVSLNLHMLPETLWNLRKPAQKVALIHSFQLPVTDRSLAISSIQQALLEEKEHIENMPKFHLRFVGSSGFGKGLSFAIKNVSNNISYEIKVYDIRLQENEKTLWESSNAFTSSNLDSKSELKIYIDSPGFNNSKELNISAYMSCKDKYSEQHEYLLRAHCVYPNIYTCEDIKEIT